MRQRARHNTTRLRRAYKKCKWILSIINRYFNDKFEHNSQLNRHKHLKIHLSCKLRQSHKCRATVSDPDNILIMGKIHALILLSIKSRLPFVKCNAYSPLMY